MTREEEIRNVIDTIFPIHPPEKGRKYEQALMATGFEGGVKWADENPKSHWIDTDEDLPYKYDNLLIKCLPYSSKETKPVLTLSDDGSYQVCVMFVNDDGKWEWSCSVVPCYWMSISEPPK